MASLATVSALYRHFNIKKNKLKWSGTLEDLKALVLTEIDEETAASTKWRSPGGGSWNFDSKQLIVTWLMKSGNICLGGEKGTALKERVNSFLKRSEICLMSDDTTDQEKSIEGLLADEEGSDGSSEEMLDGIDTIIKKGHELANRELHQFGSNEETVNSEESASIKSKSQSTSRNLHEISPNLNNLSFVKSLNGSHDNDLIRKLEAVSAKVEGLVLDVGHLKAINLQMNKQDYVNDLKEENRMLKSQIEELSERNTNLSYIMAYLHTKVKDLENEKACLTTTLKLLSFDREDSKK